MSRMMLTVVRRYSCTFHPEENAPSRLRGSTTTQGRRSVYRDKTTGQIRSQPSFRLSELAADGWRHYCDAVRQCTPLGLRILIVIHFGPTLLRNCCMIIQAANCKCHSHQTAELTVMKQGGALGGGH